MTVTATTVAEAFRALTGSKLDGIVVLGRTAYFVPSDEREWGKTVARRGAESLSILDLLLERLESNGDVGRSGSDEFCFERGRFHAGDAVAVIKRARELRAMRPPKFVRPKQPQLPKTAGVRPIPAVSGTPKPLRKAAKRPPGAEPAAGPLSWVQLTLLLNALADHHIARASNKVSREARRFVAAARSLAEHPESLRLAARNLEEELATVDDDAFGFVHPATNTPAGAKRTHSRNVGFLLELARVARAASAGLEVVRDPLEPAGTYASVETRDLPTSDLLDRVEAAPQFPGAVVAGCESLGLTLDAPTFATIASLATIAVAARMARASSTPIPIEDGRRYLDDMATWWVGETPTLTAPKAAAARKSALARWKRVFRHRRSPTAPGKV